MAARQLHPTPMTTNAPPQPARSGQEPTLPYGSQRRITLLQHNAGLWEGSFIRLDGQGHELDRFASHLEVQERTIGPEDFALPEIEAALTNGSSGAVRTMRFREPPSEMQISPDGHWSLGPSRIGPWTWVSELCVVLGDRRRRVVIELAADGLSSLVYVNEGRPGRQDPVPPAPLRLPPPTTVWQANGLSLLRWQPEADVQIDIPLQRQPDQPQMVALQWQPAWARQGARIERRHDRYGLLESISASA
ncbi:DUF3598 family protein [Synechococcus sp. CS-1328]|uniref:DUF3598 family protein n=1 Tax=Synechococcus sp. CS-1328 TaxID=2847976 RepID=UPI00223A69FD|nr:DUF3598 family protein [Synechococcus sp. CS-1328]MCT0225225.1 DUF3598 family protein [Synechococcus sp. CS-1328]